MTDIILLRQSDGYFRTLIEQASDAFFLHDIDCRFIDVNQQACASLGYTRDELLQLHVLDVEQDFDLVAARAIWTSIEPGRGVTFEGRQRRKDGSVFPVEARLSTCEIAGRRLYLGLVRDITDRRRTEAALQHSEEQYRTLFNSIDEGFCVVEILYDSEGQPGDCRFLQVNPAFEKHVGLLEAVGKTIRELVPNIEDRWVEIYGGVAKTGQAVRFTERSPSLGRVFDVYAFRLSGEGSREVAILFTNITERITAEEALRKSEKLALVGRLAGVISHEINNPLEGIANLLFLAEGETDLGAVRKYLKAAQQEVFRASYIVTHTLKFSRQSESARRERLSELMDSAIAIFGGRTKHSGIELRRVYGEQDMVACLGSELRQVFANFIGNAFDATRSGGRLTLRTRSSTNWRTGEPGVRVVIADDGCGMSKETQKHLFQAFFTTKGLEGTGLGLWVSQEILRKHQAQLRWKSRQSATGSGTVFSIWFPLELAGSAAGLKTGTDG
jgi:PAS domain S-box-containing protein